MVVKEYKKQAGVYKVQTFGTTHSILIREKFITVKIFSAIALMVYDRSL
jgi:hypothetical protein